MEKFNYSLTIDIKFSVLGTDGYIRIKEKFLKHGKTLSFFDLMKLFPGLKLTKFKVRNIIDLPKGDILVGINKSDE